MVWACVKEGSINDFQSFYSSITSITCQLSVVYIRYLQVQYIIMPFSLLHIKKNKIDTDDKAI